MKASERVTRILRIVQLLQSGRESEPAQIAAALHVSRRTVFRDLKLLNEAGVGFRFNRSRHSYRPREDALLPPTHLTSAEALALLVLIRQALADRSTAWSAEAASAAMKLESLLPRRLQDYCGPLLAGTEFNSPPTSASEGIVDRLLYFQRAIALRVKTEVEYHSLSPRMTLRSIVHPYRVFHAPRGWYLVGYCETNAAIRMFKLHRFARVQATRESFRLDRDFSLQQYLGRAWSLIREDQTWHVSVRFTPKVADNVAEVRWHETQRVRPQRDGSLQFEVDVDGLGEISWWILGYGDQATVLGPPELRDLLAERIRGMAEQYGLAVRPKRRKGA